MSSNRGIQELPAKQGRAEHDRDDRAAPHASIGDGKYSRQQGNKNVKLDLNLQRPCHHINRAVAVVDEVVKISDAGQQMRQNLSAALTRHNKQDSRPNQQTQYVRRLQASKPPQEVLFQVNLRRTEEI